MSKETEKSGGTLVRLRKDQQLPEGTSLLRPNDVLKIMRARLRKTEKYELLALKRAPMWHGTAAAISGFLVSMNIQELFQAKKFIPMFSIVASSFGCGLFCMSLQQASVTDEILTGYPFTNLQVDLRSSFLQGFFGVFLPIPINILSIYFYAIRPYQVDKKKSPAWMIKKLCTNKKTVGILAAFLYCNVTLGTLLGSEQLREFEKLANK